MTDVPEGEKCNLGLQPILCLCVGVSLFEAGCEGMGTLLAHRAGDPQYRGTSNGRNLPEAFEKVDTCVITWGRVMWRVLGCVLLAGCVVRPRLGGTGMRIVPVGSNSPVKNIPVKKYEASGSAWHGSLGTGSKTPRGTARSEYDERGVRKRRRTSCMPLRGARPGARRFVGKSVCTGMQGKRAGGVCLGESLMEEHQVARG